MTCRVELEAMSSRVEPQSLGVSPPGADPWSPDAPRIFGAELRPESVRAEGLRDCESQR